MSFLRKVVRVACTISVCTLGLLLFGVWTRFDDYNLYQNLEHLARIPQQHFYGFNLLSSDESDSSETDSDDSDEAVSVPKETVHQIVLSVCCLPNYDVVEFYAQEFVGLFHTIVIESLGTATRMTPRKQGVYSTPLHGNSGRTRTSTSTTIQLNGNSKGADVSLKGVDSANIDGQTLSVGGRHSDQFDGLATVFMHDDISLSFKKPEASKGISSPLNMVIELKHHDDVFTENLIHQVWLSAHKLEVAMATTIDSHLKRHGVISVKWILPHYESPVVSVGAEHVSSMINQLDQLETEKVETQIHLSSDNQELKDSMRAAAVLRKDLKSVDMLIVAGNQALPPLHGMQGFLDLHQLRLHKKVAQLEAEMVVLQSKEESFQSAVKITERAISSETATEKAEIAMVSTLEEQEDSLWSSRKGMLQELMQFEKEWDRMVHMTFLYESYLLQKYHVVTDRQFNLSHRFFVQEGGVESEPDVSWVCSHEEDTDFCGERVIKCTFNQDLPADKEMNIVMGTEFPEHLESVQIYDFKMMLYADYGTEDMCDSLLVSALEGTPKLVQECKYNESWACQPTADVNLNSMHGKDSMKAVCFFIDCQSTKPFAMHSTIDVKEVKQVPVEEEKEEVVEEQEPANPVEEEVKQKGPEEPTSGSLLTVMHRYTFALTVFVTMGAIIMSVFCMPLQ